MQLYVVLVICIHTFHRIPSVRMHDTYITILTTHSRLPVGPPRPTYIHIHTYTYIYIQYFTSVHLHTYVPSCGSEMKSSRKMIWWLMQERERNTSYASLANALVTRIVSLHSPLWCEDLTYVRMHILRTSTYICIYIYINIYSLLWSHCLGGLHMTRQKECACISTILVLHNA